MSAELQTLLALGVVLAAAAYLARAAWQRHRHRGGCDGCGPDRFKASLRR